MPRVSVAIPASTNSYLDPIRTINPTIKTVHVNSIQTKPNKNYNNPNSLLQQYSFKTIEKTQIRNWKNKEEINSQQLFDPWGPLWSSGL